jgi:hypothetical protein
LSLLRVVGAIAGLLSLPAALWAFLHFFRAFTDGVVVLRASQYQPAVFELEWTYLDGGVPVAVGTIDGQRELMSVRSLLPRPARSHNELEDLMAHTEHIDVLYDPSGSRTSFEGRRLRVLPYVGDLRGTHLARLWKTFEGGYAPLVVLLAICFGVARVDPKARTYWATPGLFFAGFQVVGLAFVLGMEMLEGDWPLPARITALGMIPLSILALMLLVGRRRSAGG